MLLLTQIVSPYIHEVNTEILVIARIASNWFMAGTPYSNICPFLILGIVCPPSIDLTEHVVGLGWVGGGVRTEV